MQILFLIEKECDRVFLLKFSPLFLIIVFVSFFLISYINWSRNRIVADIITIPIMKLVVALSALM